MANKPKKKTEKKVKNSDIMSEFEEACGTSAEDSDVSSIGENAKVKSDDDIWLTKNLLTFSDFCASADHMNFPPLSDKQKQMAEYMFGTDPKKTFDNNRTLAVLIWGKGSLLGHEEVITADGLRMTMAECAARGLPVRLWTKTEDGKISTQVSTPAIKKPHKEKCFLVKTSFGHTSEASEDHKYFTVKGWKKLKDLSCGDWICAAKKIRVDNIYNVSPEVSGWLGYMIGDGCTSNNFGFYASFDEIIEDFCRLTSSLGGTFKISKGTTPSARRMSLGGDSIRGIAKRFGIWKKKSSEKRIPVEVMFSSEASRKSMVSSLFATDGWVCGTPGKPKTWEIGYLSKNRLLINDLDFILRGFGIVGKIREKHVVYKNDKRLYWQIIIDNARMQVDFCKLFKIPHKSAKQNQLLIDRGDTGIVQGFECPPELSHGLVAGIPAGSASSAGGRWHGYKKRVNNENFFGYDTVCSAPWMSDLANDELIWERIDSIETIGLKDVYTFTVPNTHNYLQGGLWHHNSGKDTISALMQLYIVYLLLNLKYPQRFLNSPDMSSIDLYNVAVSQKQAQEVYFDILKKYVMRWKWLNNKWDVVANGRYFNTQSENESDFWNKVTITTDAMIFPNNIRAFSGSSESESLEGKNVLFFTLDEADAFKQESVNRSAAKIYRTLRTSANTRFPGRFKSFVISYPRSRDGFIMKMYEDTKNMLSVYGDIAPTWEVKPRHLFSKATFNFEGQDIPMDMYEDFRLDPSGSKACYLCDPPEAESPFIEDGQKVDLAMGDIRQLFDFRDVERDGLVSKGIIRSPFMYDRTIKHVLAFDLSETHDLTALSIAHREGDKIIFDNITYWLPDQKRKVKVNLQNVEEVIISICKDITVEKIHGDAWGSPMMVQKMRASGMNANIVKLDLEDYQSFKRLLYAGHIKFPKNERLMKELKNLQLVDGRKVDHIRGMHNDLSVSVVMAVKSILTLDAKSQSTGLMAEGEYVGDNLYEAVDGYDYIPIQQGDGIKIDGIIM